MASSPAAELLSAGRAHDARLALVHADSDSLNVYERVSHAVNESAALPRLDAQLTIPSLEELLMTLESDPVPIDASRLNAASVSFSLAYQLCRIGTPEKAVEVSARAVLLVRSWFRDLDSLSIQVEASPGVDWPLREYEKVWKFFATAKDASGTAACSAARALGRAAVLSLSQCNRILEARSLMELHKRCCSEDGQGGVDELSLLDAAISSASGNNARAQDILVGTTRPGCAEMLSHLSFISSSNSTSEDVPQTNAGLGVTESSSTLSCGMLNLRGISFATRADYATAQIYFQRAIREDPNCPEPVWNLALLYFAAGSVAEALELFLYLLDGNFKTEKQHNDTTIVVPTPPRCALPGRRTILWAIASAAMGLRDWALALSALEEIDVAPFPKAISSPFRMGCQISGIEIRRALACVLLHLGHAADALRTCIESLKHVPNDAEILLHAADALVSMDQIGCDDLNDGTGEHALEDLVASASSSVSFNGAEARKKRRARSHDEENEADETLKCMTLNNEALVLAAQGCEAQACSLLKRAILISPPNEQRPAFNLAVMLWQCGKRNESSELWLSWRFREQFSEGAAIDVCRQLVAELSSQRGQLLASSSSSELINAHVPSGHPSVSKLQICMLDLAVLEYRLNELTNGTNN